MCNDAVYGLDCSVVLNFCSVFLGMTGFIYLTLQRFYKIKIYEENSIHCALCGCDILRCR